VRTVGFSDSVAVSPVAIRCRFGSAEPRPPISFPSPVPRPSSRFKSALSFFHHQLRTKVRSMDGLRLRL
jgi:hypothetical protein